MPAKLVEELFGAAVPEDIPPSWNIAPGQPILAVADYEGRRELLGFTWGLRPAWAKPESGGRAHVNARSETVFEKPAFRDAAAHHRCLVPASFFYEWKKNGRDKTPHAVMLPGMAPFAMAGIFSMHETSEHEILGPSLAILTCAANQVMRPIHERMPVILPPRAYAGWLAPHTHREDLAAMLVPYGGPMTAHAVSPRVNSPQHNDASLPRPASAQGELPLG